MTSSACRTAATLSRRSSGSGFSARHWSSASSGVRLAKPRLSFSATNSWKVCSSGEFMALRLAPSRDWHTIADYSPRKVMHQLGPRVSFRSAKVRTMSALSRTERRHSAKPSRSSQRLGHVTSETPFLLMVIDLLSVVVSGVHRAPKTIQSIQLEFRRTFEVHLADSVRKSVQ
jgi:hypothetical protein